MKNFLIAALLPTLLIAGCESSTDSVPKNDDNTKREHIDIIASAPTSPSLFIEQSGDKDFFRAYMNQDSFLYIPTKKIPVQSTLNSLKYKINYQISETNFTFPDKDHALIIIFLKEGQNIMRVSYHTMSSVKNLKDVHRIEVEYETDDDNSASIDIKTHCQGNKPNNPDECVYSDFDTFLSDFGNFDVQTDYKIDSVSGNFFLKADISCQDTEISCNKEYKIEVFEYDLELD